MEPSRDGSHQHGSLSRPYRSKRHPPCFQCRRKKLRCDAQRNRTCRRCVTAGVQCSFASLQRPAVASTEPEPTVQSEGHRGNITSEEARTAFTTIDAPFDSHLPEPAVEDTVLPSQPVYHLPERPTPQAIQTLDGLQGFSYQVIGASGESDPWLLRHCKFDERGFLLFHQVHFRNAGGVPLDDKIPVHFLVTADHLYEPAKQETKYAQRNTLRDELDSLVPLECGQRLVSL